ncbi:MAG TPA: DPP IV N-terminal domain-containing protein [Gammaproteobacteria bacterium]|nr:DPP IV N-terminal domain-containing protein [Gammaproteobacteria bacterium]
MRTSPCSWMLAAFAAVALTACGFAARADNHFYTIADIFAEPGMTGFAPRDVEWSPDGKKLTFLLQHKVDGLADLYVIDTTTGKRSVLISGKTLAGAAASPNNIKNERKKERITRYGVNSYHWSPKGDAIFYLSHDQVYLYDIASGKTRQITHEPGDKRDPKLSPDEQWVSYVTNGDLHYTSVDGGKVYSVARHQDGILNGGMDWVYPEELALRSGYEWSPDSRYIAFMQFDERPVEDFPLVNYVKQNPTVYNEKYPLAGAPNPIVRLGIQSIASHRTRWIDGVAGTDNTYLARIGWQPKGRETAYAQVLNRAQTKLDIITVNPQSGATHTLFSETDPYWIDVTDSLHFLKQGGFIFDTCQDGWQHVWLFDAQGKAVRNLTPGDFNVLSVDGVDEKNGYVYYTAALTGPLDTDLFRAPFSGGTPTQLTNGHGTHHIDMGPKAQVYLDYYSDVTTPTAIALRSVTAGPIALVQPAAKLPYHFQRPRLFTIKAADGKTDLYASMIVPPDFDPHRKYPVIMYQYGGPHAFSVVRDAWGGADFLYDQILARDGFILFAVDNRAAGYFSHTAQAQVQYKLGPLELADQRAAVNWLQSQPYVDDNHIGIWGWSYGGYMTTYELTHAPGVWAAGIAVAPVTRWQNYDSIYTERYMGMPQKNKDGYKASSSVAAAGNLSDPLLLVAGTGDDNVHWQNTIQFIQALIEHRRPYQLLIYPNKTHGISGPDARTHLFTAMKRFWEQHLKTQ